MTENEILLDKITQTRLAVMMAECFPDASRLLGLSNEKIADVTGIDPARIDEISQRQYIPAWSEFMALIFLFVSSEKSREFVESKGLFPDELKEAMSINRKAHE